MSDRTLSYAEHGDDENPRNWRDGKKWWMSFLTAFMTLGVSFGSSVFSTATTAVAKEFPASTEVLILSVSLYVAGFACGPLFFGPLSEAYGRRLPLLGGYLGFLLFQIPVGTASDLRTILVARFFAGAFGSAPLAICAGIYVDLWDDTARGVAALGYIAAVFSGPAIGPIAGDYISHDLRLGWRWTAWITMIVSGIFFVLALFGLPETLNAVILERRAARIRADNMDSITLEGMGTQQEPCRTTPSPGVVKSLLMIAREPILIILTLYTSVVYGILYLQFFAFPLSFSTQRKWGPGLSSLPFVSILVGVGMACTMLGLGQRRYRNNAASANPSPEMRLLPMMVGSIFMVVGLLWFAWTSSTKVSWILEVISGVLIGCGIVCVFTSAVVYLMEIYFDHANSALAVNAFTRSVVAAGFTLVASPMYDNLGIPWASSLLALLCLIFTPFPFLLYFYGKAIRSWSATCWVRPVDSV